MIPVNYGIFCKCYNIYKWRHIFSVIFFSLIFIRLLTLAIPAYASSDAEQQVTISGDFSGTVTQSDPVDSRAIDVAPGVEPVVPAANSAAEDMIPDWPYQIFTKKEREARLKVLFRDYQFHLTRHGKNIDEKTCQNLLQALSSSQEKVLEPLVTYVKDRELGYVHKMSKCESVPPLMKIYQKNYKADINDDPEFQKLGETEKLQKSNYYFQATENIEYYDLSSFFKEKMYGYMAEGLRRHCNPKYQYLCEKFTGFREYLSGILALTFSPDTCQVTNYSRLLRLSRFTEVSHSPLKRTQSGILDTGYDYLESGDFAAFVEINGSAYLVNTQNLWELSNFAAKEANEVKPYLIVHSIPRPIAPSTENVCIFQN